MMVAAGEKSCAMVAERCAVVACAKFDFTLTLVGARARPGGGGRDNDQHD
jgi:hypothetical protein